MAPLKILIAPDSYKGSVTAAAAAAAIAEGIRKVLPAEVQMQPMADGGEGTGEIVRRLGGQTVPTETVDIFGRPMTASWIRFGRLAVVEAAQASGYVPPHQRIRDGTQTTSLGTGILIEQAFADPAIDSVAVALGGTGCTDGGFGLLQALGARFTDRRGEPVEQRGDLMGEVATVVPPQLTKPLMGLCDVMTPLLGPQGSVQMFGGQKGIPPSQAAVHESRLAHFAQLVSQAAHVNPDTPGAGAAGGMGFGILAAGGQLTRGAEQIGNWIQLDRDIDWCDWVITGEGRIDGQSSHGKVVGTVAQHASDRQKPVIALVGERGAGPQPLLHQGLTLIFPIVPGPMTRDEAMQHGPELLVEAGEQVGALLRYLAR